MYAWISLLSPFPVTPPTVSYHILLVVVVDSVMTESIPSHTQQKHEANY